jgi:hypothetical protein
LPATPNSAESLTLAWHDAQVLPTLPAATAEAGSLGAAHRGHVVAARNGRAVSALHKRRLHVGVALAAGYRNVELGNRRLGIGALQDVVGAMAVGTDRRVLGSSRNRFTVNALFIGAVGRGTDSAARHHQLLAVARAAGCRDVGVRNFGFGIGVWQDCMHVAVAVLALGDVIVSRRCRLGVDAVLIRGLLVGMTGGTDRLGWNWIVRKRLNVGVAVRTSERIVYGRLEVRVVHVQADLIAVLVLCQGRVAVTGQAFLVAHFRRFGRAFRCGHRHGREQRSQ